MPNRPAATTGRAPAPTADRVADILARAAIDGFSGRCMAAATTTA